MDYIIFQGFKTTKQKISVSKILCLGLNYENHIAEMKSKKPEAPVIFMKPPSAIIHNNQSVILPSFSSDVHHEVEIVAAIGKTCRNVSLEEAADYIAGFGIGLDMTLRDIQGQAKSKGHPWTIAKGFDTSAPVSEIINKRHFPDTDNIGFSLEVNGEVRQQGNTRDMIFKLPEIISYLSSIFTLNRGDLIFTGTPEGVGPVKPGDKLKATLGNLITLNVGVKGEAEDL